MRTDKGEVKVTLQMTLVMISVQVMKMIKTITDIIKIETRKIVGMKEETENGEKIGIAVVKMNMKRTRNIKHKGRTEEEAVVLRVVLDPKTSLV